MSTFFFAVLLVLIVLETISICEKPIGYKFIILGILLFFALCLFHIQGNIKFDEHVKLYQSGEYNITVKHPGADTTYLLK